MAVADVVVKHVCRNLRNENASTDLVAKNLGPFLDGEPLGRLDLSGLNISYRTLGLLLAAQQSTLTSLDLSHIDFTLLGTTSICGMLTDLKVKSLKVDSLKVTSSDLLQIPRFRNFFKSNVQVDLVFDNDWDQKIATDNELAYNTQKVSSAQETNLELIEPLRHFVEFCPNIQHLYLQQKVPNLTTLILYDVQNLESCIPMISGLKNLKCLDLSQSERTTGHYIKPVTCLHTLVIELPNLECLDISGTNLNSDISDDDRPCEGIVFVPSYIAGLSFLSRPLKYLGIFNCDDAIGQHFENIPAEKICCDQGEDQIILALEAYMSRPRMMKTVLVKSCQLYCFETDLKRHVDALHLILKVLTSHRTNSSLQVAGHGTMFYILIKVEMNRDTKRAVLCELLYAMENHMDEQEMMTNCCHSLNLFKIPQDFLLNYIQIAKLLVRVLIAHGSILNIQQVVLVILDSMTRHLDQSHKILLGPIGIIEIILELIRRKLAAGTCDGVMQLCWTVLCNMTDETPSNSERFVKADGLKLFSQCISRFLNHATLVVNMVILVGNVAEVKCLRSQLINNDFLKIFWSLLRMYPNFNSGFDISYSSAYVLAHLASELEAGSWQSAMCVCYVARRSYVASEKLMAAIGAWDLSTKILFQYKSLKPILQLLTMFHSPASVHWAVWALANLTSTDPEKYCRYIDEEDGEKLVRKLVYDLRVHSRTSILARVVLANMDNWRNSGAITASATSNEAIVPAEQNSNPYLKKVTRIMMKFLASLPESTLVSASLYVGSYERAIRSSYMLS
ncbi:zyg eleven-related protein 1 [Ditylenchus destructor]|nr:zyg eleven-related protein 1 [Ditylenchus destructor]